MTKAAEFEAAKIADIAAKNKQVDQLGAANIESVKQPATRKAALSGRKATMTFKIFESFDEIEYAKAFSSVATIDTSFAGAYIVKRNKTILIGKDNVGTAFGLFTEKLKASESSTTLAEEQTPWVMQLHRR